MSKQQRVDKASDIFAKTDYFAGKTTDFHKAHPKIEKVQVTLIETGAGVSEYMRERNYDETNLPGQFIDCHNPRCYGGGIDIGQILQFMEASNIIEREDEMRCRGTEGSPKGRKLYTPCFNRFKLKISIVYKG